jgi:hypothetical protein
MAGTASLDDGDGGAGGADASWGDMPMAAVMAGGIGADAGSGGRDNGTLGGIEVAGIRLGAAARTAAPPAPTVPESAGSEARRDAAISGVSPFEPTLARNVWTRVEQAPIVCP